MLKPGDARCKVASHYMIQMMAWLEQERLEGEREVGEGDTYVVYQVRHLPHLVDTWPPGGLLLVDTWPPLGRYLTTRCSSTW